MRKGISYRVTGLLLGTGLVALAGGPGACEAQLRTDSDQKRLALSAAIEEALRSPFHARAEVGEPAVVPRAPIGMDIALASSVLQLAPQEGDPPSRPVVPATFVVAGLSHLAATYMFWNSGSSGTRWILAPIVPLVATPIPALLAGTHAGRAFGASLAGLLYGGAAYFGAMTVTGNLLVATGASSLVHAGIVTAWLRER